MILLLLMIFQAMHTNIAIHDPLACYSVNVIHYFDDGIKGWDVCHNTHTSLSFWRIGHYGR